MPRDPDKAKQALERKAVKREQKQDRRSLVHHSAPGWLQRAAGWPIHEVLLASRWQEQAALAGILIARSFQGQIAGGTFLVDLACLGVKSSAVRLFKSRRDYDRDMRQRILESQPMMPADINLVAKIVETGVEYAQALGFDPDPTYYQARVLLGDADPAASPMDVPVGGPEGKPFFVAGPYDDVRQIMARLTRAVGPDGFHYVAFVGPDLMPLGSDTELFLDDDQELLLDDDEER